MSLLTRRGYSDNTRRTGKCLDCLCLHTTILSQSMSYPKRLLSVGSKLRTYKLRTAPVFLTLDPCQFFGGFTKLGAVCHSHEPGTRSFTGIAACVRVEVIYCDRRDGLIVVVIACDFLAADVSTSIFLKDSATTSTSMFANMKLLSLATAIRSTCAVRREPCSMSFDMYTVHKCSRAPDSSLSAVVGVACQSLDGSFDLDTLNGWAEEGCQIIFHTDTDCCDVGCQALALVAAAMMKARNGLLTLSCVNRRGTVGMTF